MYNTNDTKKAILEYVISAFFTVIPEQVLGPRCSDSGTQTVPRWMTLLIDAFGR